MEYRRLGGSGVKVSEISLGSWLTYGGSVAEEQATACINRAYEIGINFFDTANVYMRGAAEEIVGRALRDFERDSYFLATKVYFPMGEGPNDSGSLTQTRYRAVPRFAKEAWGRLHRPLPVPPLR